jgi:hypothetical protein
MNKFKKMKKKGEDLRERFLDLRTPLELGDKSFVAFKVIVHLGSRSLKVL